MYSWEAAPTVTGVTATPAPPCCVTNPACSSTNACAQLWSNPPKLSLTMQTLTFSLFSNLSYRNQRKHLLPTGTLLCPCYTKNPNAHPSADLFPIYLQVLLREAMFQNNFQEVNHFTGLFLRFSSQNHEMVDFLETNPNLISLIPPWPKVNHITQAS